LGGRGVGDEKEVGVVLHVDVVELRLGGLEEEGRGKGVGGAGVVKEGGAGVKNWSMRDLGFWVGFGAVVVVVVVVVGVVVVVVEFTVVVVVVSKKEVIVVEVVEVVPVVMADVADATPFTCADL
jgi:hypothetical protein